ncbi:hypothetical protein GF367_02710 [Candidatus Woesearchaeota archaeon]|nr:hypothetical protein [Candidatus Woesearchaeota archaeon]
MLSDGKHMGLSHILPDEHPRHYIDGMLKELDTERAIEGIILTGNTSPSHNPDKPCRDAGIDIIDYFPKSLPVVATPTKVLPDMLRYLSANRTIITNPPYSVTVRYDEEQISLPFPARAKGG